MTRVPEVRYPLTPLQEGMLFHHLSDPHSGIDIEQIVCTLPEPIDAVAMEGAWQAVVARHDLLGTAFRWHDLDSPQQEIHPGVDLPFVVHDWSQTPTELRNARFAEFLRTDRRLGFDLAFPPLMRLTLIRWGAADHQLVVTLHHAILDGRAFMAVLREALDDYDADGKGEPPALPERLPFKAHVDWLQQQDWTRARKFWTNMLDGFAAATPLPGAPRPAAPGAAWPEQRTTLLSSDVTAALREMAADANVALTTLVLAAWTLLLSAHAGDDDVAFGVVRAGRQTSVRNADSIIGLLINTLPLRIAVDRGGALHLWLQSVRQSWQALGPFEHTSLALAHECSPLPPGQALFDTVVVFEQYEFAEVLRRPGGLWAARDFELYEQNGFPISLSAWGGTRLKLQLEYDASRYDAITAEALLDQLQTLLEAFPANSARPVGEIPILSPARRREVVETFNATTADFATDEVLHDLLATRAAQNPAAIAVECDGAALSYGELDARATTLARALASRGAGPGVLVGVCLERSLDLVVALLGVLKAGSAYVPMDPEYPVERLAFMMADAHCPIVLTQQAIAESRLHQWLVGADGTDAGRAAILCLDRDWARIAADGAPNVPLAPARPDDLAYMIFTSGSSGRPKGVEIEHRNLVNLLESVRRRPGLEARDVMVAVTTVSFDIAGLEIFLPLLAGARVVLAPRAVAVDGQALGELIARSGATVMQATPATWRVLLETGWTNPSHIRMLCGGEALPATLAAELLATGGELWNMYGPTETTIWSSVDAVAVSESDEVVPIGGPIDNTTFYVLDAQMQPVPIGVAGELYIGGEGVSRGYLNRPELTAARFVPDPFAARRDARLYRTGDRMHWRADGRLEFLGRTDQQVKMRGYRIETGEIESVLREHDGIVDAVAIVREDQPGMQRLVAYVQLVPGAAEVDWAVHLSERLPPYMVPSAVMQLAAFPQTPNGKVDRKALPAPDRLPAVVERVPPRDEIEAGVLRIWRQVLGTEQIGVTDHFNAVGGHSFAAVKVFNRIAREFGRQIPLAAMLKDDTVAKQAALLRQNVAVDSWRCLVPLTTTGTGAPVFCPHAQTGNILIYQHFAKELAGKHPVYALQALGNWGTQQPHESVEQMVACYLEEITRLQPRGPYIFFGASMGGWIALELARALKQRGEDVQLVVLYDTWGPGYPRRGVYGRIAKFIRSHGGISYSRIRSVLDVDPGHRRSGRVILRRSRELIEWWIDNNRRNWLCWRFAHRNPPHGYPLRPNTTRFWLAARRIGKRFQPRFFPGKVTLLRADVQPAGAIPDPMLGWTGLAAEVEVHAVPQGHTGGLHPPYVAGVAALVLRCAAAAEQVSRREARSA